MAYLSKYISIYESEKDLDDWFTGLARRQNQRAIEPTESLEDLIKMDD